MLRPAAVASAHEDVGHSATGSGRPSPSRVGSLVAITLGVVVAAQALFVVGLIGPGPLLRGEALIGDDHALHLASATATRESWRQSHRLWGYSPYHMAGYPVGTLDSMSNHWGHLAVATLAFLPAPQAFAVGLALLYLLPPFCGWLTGRLLGLSAAVSAATAACFCLVFSGFVDGPRAYLSFGMYAHAVVLVLAPLTAVAARRAAVTAGVRAPAILALALTLGLMLHPFFAVAAGPAVAVALAMPADRPTSPGRRRAAPTLAVIIAAALNLWWLLPAARVWGDYGRMTSPFFQNTLEAFQSSLASPLAILWLGGAAGVATLWRQGRHADAAILATGALTALALGGFGELTPWTRSLLPARFIDGVAFFAIPPACFVASRWASRPGWRPIALAAIAVAIFALPAWSFTRTVAGQERIIAWTGRPWGDGRLQQSVVDLVAWLRDHTTPEARILLEDADHDRQGHRYGDTHLPAWIPFLVDRQIVGGPLEDSRLAHHFVDFRDGHLCEKPLATLSDANLLAYLELYNVGWIVSWSESAETGLRRRPFIDELETLSTYRIWSVRRPRSFVESGSEVKVSASVDRLSVEGAPPGTTILLYHWMKGVETWPRLEVRRVERLDDPVGFIAVENGDVSDFEIRFR